MSPSGQVGWRSFLPRTTHASLFVLLAGLLSLVILGITPRSVSTLRLLSHQCRDPRRPKPPRHTILSSVSGATQAGQTVRRLPRLWEDAIPAESFGGRFSFCTRESVPARVSSELTKPDYLKLYAGPILQNSPPA